MNSRHSQGVSGFWHAPAQRGLGGIELDEIPGLLEGALGVANRNPFLFSAQIFPLGELESSERAGFFLGQRRVGLVVPVEVFFNPLAACRSQCRLSP